MSGDKYTVWCGSLYSDSWFKRLAVLPTVAVTVRFLSRCYCTFCHFIKAQTWHTFERCVAPLHKNSIWGGTSIKTHACTEAEEEEKENKTPVAPLPVFGAEEVIAIEDSLDRILHDVLQVGIILFTCWNTGWSITLPKKGRWWVTEVITQQVINKHKHTSHCTHTLSVLLPNDSKSYLFFSTHL